MNVDLGSIIAGLALLAGTIFTGIVSMRNARQTGHGADAERLAQYERWRPRMLRLVGDLRALLALHGVEEPAAIDETLRFPPKDEKVTPDAG